MRAEEEPVYLTFEVEDNDFDAAINDEEFEVVAGTSLGETIAKYLKTEGAETKASLVSYSGDLSYVNDDLYGVVVTVTTYVDNESGYHKVDTQKLGVGTTGMNLVDFKTNLKAAKLQAGDEVVVVISTVIDYAANGALYNPSTAINSDGDDDRDQTVVTVKEEGWNDRTDKGTGEFSSTKYVADDNDTIEKVIKAAPGYDDRMTVKVDGKRVTYRRVYYVNGTTIEGVWEAHEDKDSGRIVWNKKPGSTGPVDLDGDGKISCDEYYGTTGLEWSDKLNACVVSSTGDAVVTIPNTATR